MSGTEDGASFEVWAPNAARVEVEIEGTRHALVRVENDWFRGHVPGTGTDTEYAFALDGGPPRPDPRSSFQPHGIHGASRLVDHAAFAWSGEAWKPPPLHEWIVYELHVGTFTPAGTFDGVIDKLDHLVELGVTAVEFMPVAEFSGDHGWGYDGVDLYAPHHLYGDPESLKRLVDGCHRRGLATILDVVYNHLGPAGNYLNEFGPYFTDRYATPWGQAVNLDGPHSDEVRRFLIDNARQWLSTYHFDALRIDAVHAFVDTSAMHFLEQLAIEVDELESATGRDVYVIAESDLNDARLVRSRQEGGYGLDAQWSDDFHHALHALLTGERNGYYSDFGTVDDLARALRDTFVYGGRYSSYRKRTHGRAPTGIPRHRFLGYLQNHDQIGNRARGERIGHLVDAERVKLGAAVVLLSPFIPLLFQGEEWAANSPFQYFTTHEDPALGRAVAEGRGREFARFGWAPEDVPDPQDPATFKRSRLRWEELEAEPHASILDWYRQLIGIRKRFLGAPDADLEVHCSDNALSFIHGPITVDADFEAPSVEVRAHDDVLLRAP